MNDTPTSTKLRPTRAASPSRDDWLVRVDAVGPFAAESAEVADREHQLSAELMAALHEQGLFRLLLPRAQNGFELDLPDYFHVMEAVASHDASTAWCVCQANCCATMAAYVDAGVADRMWGQNPAAVLSWGPGMAEARVVDGGYLLTAKSAFASGCHHATWLGVHAPAVYGPDGAPRTGADGKPENRTMFFPADGIEIIENWDVLGLRGTGSDGFAVDELFVPEEFTIVRATMMERRPAHGAGPLYAFPHMALHSTGFATVALGTARRFINEFLGMAQDKVPRQHTTPLRDKPVVQDEVALAEARLSAARAFLLSEVEQAWAEAIADEALTMERRMRIRLATTHAIREAKAAVDILYDSAGTSSIYASGPFERRFRDIHMVVQQIQARRAHYQAVGAFMLGHPPDMTAV